MKRLISILWNNAPGLMILAIVAGVITGASSTVMISLINTGVNQAPDVPTYMVIIYACLCVAMPASLIATQYILSTFSQKMTYDLRMQLTADILAAPLRRLEELGKNELIASLTTDVATISQAMIVLPAVMMQSTILVGALIYLGYLYWPAAVGIVFAVIIGVFIYNAISAAGMKQFEVARENQDKLFKHFESLTSGTKELKLNEKRSTIFQKDWLHTTAHSLLVTLRSAAIYFATAASVSRFVFFSVIGIYIFYLPKVDPAVNGEVLSGFALVMLYLFSPLESLTSIIPAMGNAMVSLKKVENIGSDLKRAKVDDFKSEAMTSFNSIEVKGMTHTYHVEHEERNFTMGPINLNFKPGELVLLVGGNGSGKTTLAKLLLGLYKPEGGDIIVDGVPITDQNRQAYRQLFSAVFVDFFLFDELVGFEDDAFKDQDIDEKASEYLKLLLLDHKVSIKDGRLSTTSLSQGQRKRLALLTAYLEDRPIYLFDEWAADQDPSFKKVFYRKLLPELKAKGKMVIAISHDDAYFDVADRIIRLDYGQVEQDEAISKTLLDAIAKTHHAMA